MEKVRRLSAKTIAKIQLADPDKPGVKLALLCIKNDIPLEDVAQYVGSSRASVYGWFMGTSTPLRVYQEKILKLISRLENEVAPTQ